MTYKAASKWALVPTIGIIILVLGNAAYYYLDQPGRWHNSLIINGLIGIPAAALLIYAATFLCLAAVVTLVNRVRKSPAHT